MNRLLDHFDALTAHGLKIVPIRENSKKPLCKGWTKGWDHKQARERFQCYPELNIGLLLGEIVDVEGDSDAANREILRLIGDYPHPSYTSTKSIHHLFLTPDPKLRLVKFRHIEFRGYGHQSLLPPSQHLGVQYKWLKGFRFPVPEMPPALKQLYFDHIQKRKRKNTLKPGHIRVWCSKCEDRHFLHEKRYRLECMGFSDFGLRWQCHNCRTIDMRPICRRIRRSAISQKTY